jgi:hypothetical protein
MTIGVGSVNVPLRFHVRETRARRGCRLLYVPFRPGHLGSYIKCKMKISEQLVRNCENEKSGNTDLSKISLRIFSRSSSSDTDMDASFSAVRYSHRARCTMECVMLPLSGLLNLPTIFSQKGKKRRKTRSQTYIVTKVALTAPNTRRRLSSSIPGASRTPGKPLLARSLSSALPAAGENNAVSRP